MAGGSDSEQGEQRLGSIRFYKPRFATREAAALKVFSSLPMTYCVSKSV